MCEARLDLLCVEVERDPSDGWAAGNLQSLGPFGVRFYEFGAIDISESSGSTHQSLVFYLTCSKHVTVPETNLVSWGALGTPEISNTRNSGCPHLLSPVTAPELTQVRGNTVVKHLEL